MSNIPISAYALLFAFCVSAWIMAGSTLPANQALILLAITLVCAAKLMIFAVNLMQKLQLNRIRS